MTDTPAGPSPTAQWWRSLFDTSEDALVVCDPWGTVLAANPRSAQLLGFANAQQVSAHALRDALTPATATKLATLLARKDARPESLPSVTLACGGRLNLIADLQTTPLGDGCSLVTLKDASRRWRMESHLQRLMTAVDATPDVFFLTDAEFKLTFVNAAFQAVTGHSIEDALGRTADFLRAPEEAEAIREYLARVAAGQDWCGELRNVRADGSTYPVSATISPIYDRNGGFLGYVASERDISTRQRLEGELQRERDFVHSILDSMEAAIYTVDSEFRITHVSDGWRKFPAQHGWLAVNTPPQVGDAFLDLVHGHARRGELMNLFLHVLTTGELKEVPTTDPAGRHWLIKVSPWREGEKIAGLIYQVSDQTNLHELQRQLYQAQKMETIGALASGVAHDFNNLLQAVRGNAGLLLMDRQLTEPQRLRLQHVDQAASRAADITQQLLSFSRASDETITVFDLNELMLEVSQLARRTLKSRVKFELRPAPAPVKVRMDSTRANQLLLNLCVNAQDAMPNGGTLTLSNAVVRLSAPQAARVNVSPGVEFVQCSVSDTGTGIPPEILARIFDPFFTTKCKGKGTGLGLSIAHSVVTQAGGFLDVESKPGVGTTFHIFLPAVDAALTVSRLVMAAGPRRGIGRVLVVDDLDLIRDFAQAFLEEAGFEVLVAGNALEAIAALETSPVPVELLFTDYNMPGMTGVELMQAASVRWPELKFILASGYLEEPERQRVAQLPGARIVNKPYNAAEAVELIVELLTRDA